MIYQFLFYTIPRILEGGNPDGGVRQGRGGRVDGRLSDEGLV